MAIPIFNASSVLLNQNPGTLPNVSRALLNWFQPLNFVTIVKTVVNFAVVETLTTVNFLGVRQPFTPQMLLMKPEGERQWKWETIHALPGLILSPDDIITFLGVNYRVMQKLDWKEYGFVEYHIVQDYTG